MSKATLIRCLVTFSEISKFSQLLIFVINSDTVSKMFSENTYYLLISTSMIVINTYLVLKRNFRVELSLFLTHTTHSTFLN